MSNDNPDKDLNLDLHFLPSWAQESPEINRYANYDGERRGGRVHDRRGGPRRSGGGGGGDRPRGPRQDRNRDRQGGDRPGGDRFRGKGKGPRHDRKGGKRPFEKRQEAPLPEVNLTIVPEEKGVDLLTKQIRVTGRAYPLFDIARLVLQKEDRYRLEFATKKNAEGKIAQPIFSCALDDTVWLSEEDAVAHVLDKHLATFYEVKKTPTDPPKGTYTFVAQCGMSGVILGPPNYHDYQNKLRQLHAEKFARMPFEKFKSRVKIVKDEDVVKQWVDEQSFKTEYEVLNVPEPLTLASFAEVQKHFRETHLPSMIKSVDTHLVKGESSRRVGARELQRLVFRTVDEQKRFPLKLVTTLSQKFATRGLQFFKVNKTIVHVAVARPHFLDLETTNVSDGVKNIVNYVNDHPRCSVKELVDFLAPKPVETQPEAVSEAKQVDTAEAPTEGAPAPAAEKPAHPEATEEQKQVLADLHWLVHQGHVIEFASGELETAKKPNPKPQPKPKKAQPKPAESAPKVEAPPETTPAESPVSTPAPAAVSAEQPALNQEPKAESAAEEPEESEVRRPVIDGSAVSDLQMEDEDPVSSGEQEQDPETPGEPATETITNETASSDAEPVPVEAEKKTD